MESKKIKGIIPPLVTPLLDDNTIDLKGAERLVEHLIKGGVHGLFILGTTGESQSVGFKIREKMIEHTAKIVNGRIPLLVGISDTSVCDSLLLAQKAADCGADAVVSAPPYYYAAAQPEMCEFYEKLIPQLPLPIFLYNMPTHTKVSFAPSTIHRIAENPKVIGFKDSSGSGSYLQSVIYAMRDQKDFSIFVGPEEMMAESVLMGADGGVNGGANMFPQLYVKLFEAAQSGDIARCRELQKIVMQVSAAIYNVGNYGSSYLKGLKCALGHLGICSDVLASPFNRFDGLYSESIERGLDEIVTSLQKI